MTEVAMHRKIAFAGVGEAVLSKTAVPSALDLAVEASQAALADAGLTPLDVDGVLTASPAGDPHFMFSTLLVEALGVPARINTALQSAGASPCIALLYAARAIMSGACHTVLVCESSPAGLTATCVGEPPAGPVGTVVSARLVLVSITVSESLPLLTT